MPAKNHFNEHQTSDFNEWPYLEAGWKPVESQVSESCFRSATGWEPPPNVHPQQMTSSHHTVALGQFPNLGQKHHTNDLFDGLYLPEAGLTTEYHTEGIGSQSESICS